MLEVYATARFKKDLKAQVRRGCDPESLWAVVSLLRQGTALPGKHADHALSGDYSGFRECHIRPDWLLVYRVENELLILTLARTGTHSDLF